MYKLCLYFVLLRIIQSFDMTSLSYSARFDGNGSRLLCRLHEENVVYNVPASSTDMVQLKAPGYCVYSNHGCFAGDDDELVVSQSTNLSLFIWSVPDGQGDRTIDQPLLLLPGHQYAVRDLRYSKITSTLASGDHGGVIKLWSPSNGL